MYCFCMKFVQLILRKITKIVANIRQILKLKFSKMQFRLTPLGELTALPIALAGFNGPTSKRKEGERRGSSGGYRGVPGRPQPLQKPPSQHCRFKSLQNSNLGQGKNAKYYVQMYRKLYSGGLRPQTRYQSLATGPHQGSFDPPASLATLSGNQSLFFSLWLCFSNDVCSAPNSQRTRNQRHGSSVNIVVLRPN